MASLQELRSTAGLVSCMLRCERVYSGNRQDVLLARENRNKRNVHYVAFFSVSVYYSLKFPLLPSEQCVSKSYTEVRERSVLSRQLQLDVAQLTDVGRKRPHNEDNMAYVIPKDDQAMAHKGALFIVADGMGGHAAGEVASEIAVETVTKAYYEDENDDIPLSLINAIKRANAIIHQRADENALRSGMGTACVSAVLCGNIA